MENYKGDFAEDAMVRGGFNTRVKATGAPITLAGTPTLVVYKDASVAKSVAGVAAISIDFDDLTGYHLFAIDTSADAFYATGSDYRIVLTAGTVDGESVVGVEVGSFSIENRFVRSEPPTAAANATQVRTELATELARIDAAISSRSTFAGGAVASVTAPVTVGTNNDKTGYSLSQAFPANFASLGINASGHVTRVVLVDTTTTNTDMRGTDSALLAASYAAAPTAAANADAVWDEILSGHAISGSTGAALAAPSGGGGGSVSVNVLPAVGIVADRSPGATISPVVGETISQSITLYQTDGTTPVDLSGKTLAIVFETMTGVDVAVVASGNITISGDDDNVVTFAYPSAVTASERTLRFAIKDEAAPLTEYLKGLCNVTSGPRVDA